MSATQYIIRVRHARGRYLVTETGGGYEGQKIRDARQAKYGNKPDPTTGLYLDEMWRYFGRDEVVSLREAQIGGSDAQ